MIAWIARNTVQGILAIVAITVVVMLVVFFLVTGGCQPGNSLPSAPTPKPTAQAAPPYMTPKAQVPPTPKPTAQGVCPEVAIRTEPQGVLQADRSFVAQLGNTGCDTVFEGRIWESGKGIQDRHDIVLIRGARDGFRYWEGNGWLLPKGWNVNDVACMLWDGKKTNWISQGINPLPVQFWGFDSAPKCSAAVQSVPTVSIKAQVNQSQSIQVTPSGSLNWAKVLTGVPADRLEACPGEAQDKCVHLKDGAMISVSIPAGYKLEGWDGSKVVQGNGPMTVKVSGLTVRPR